MMKKLCTLFLVLFLLVIGTCALAASADGKGDMIARNAELAAFMDNNGNIFVSGVTTPVNTTKASSIISIDPYRILFFAESGSGFVSTANRLLSLDLNGFKETIVSDDAAAACIDGDEVFYISAAKPTQLKRYDLDTGKTDTAYSSVESMQRLYACTDGVVVTLVDNAGAYIYDTAFKTFVPYNETLAVKITRYDGFDVFLSDDQTLMLKTEGAATAQSVDTHVKDWAVVGDTVYYISGSGINMNLKSFDVSNAVWSNIMTLPLGVKQELTASNNSLFLLSDIDSTVYTLDTADGSLKTFASLPALSSYALGNAKVLTAFRLEAVSGQLNIYGAVAGSNVGTMFSFVEYSGQSVRNEQEYILLSAYPIKEEVTVWDLLQPAKQYAPLRKGSRGEAVSAIQRPLKEKGYYNYYIDGIFGWRTERAVELLQADLGLPVTGIADAELQRIILANQFAAYDPYAELSRGDRGLRVLEMQQRLRDLGYLADDADGIFGPRTQQAVELFQNENNLRVTGIADKNTLKKLYSDTANVCSSYIELQYGDSGYRVRELNKRLKKLYYLEGDIGSTYNSATRAAVIRFQQEVGLRQNGIATVTVQQKLFSKYAPEYSGYVTLMRGDDNARVKRLQRRLAELGYYDGNVDGYFGKGTYAAVKLFQRAVGLKSTGIADPITKAEIYSADAPHYREPVEIGIPVIELSAYSKLENGIYQISDVDTVAGSFNASWYTEGPVASFDMSLKDDRGTVYMQNYGLPLDQNIISIPLDTLSDERTYTITVTANPDPENDYGATSDSIRFIRVITEPEPEPDELGTIGKLIISPVGSDIIREGGVYLIPGEKLSFNWSADGSVSGYVYDVKDASEEVLFGNNNIEQTTEFNVEAAVLSEDKTYTLTVYAIPTNGSITDATIESILFRPFTASAEASEATQEDAPAYIAEEAPVYAPKKAPAYIADEAPEAETESDEALVEIGAPVISFDPEIGATVGENGENIVLVGETEQLMIYWDAEGEVTNYHVSITNPAGGEIAGLDTDSENGALPISFLERGVVYTVNVTANPESEARSSAFSSAAFMLPKAEASTEPEYVSEESEYVPEEPEYVSEEPDYIQEEPEYVPEEPDYVQEEPEYVPEEPDYVQEEPEYTPEEQEYVQEPLSIGTPMLTIEPCISSEMNEYDETVYYIEDQEEIEFKWYADGNIDGYQVKILDEYDVEVFSTYIYSDIMTLPVQDLTPNMMYRLDVTAVAAEDPSVTAHATALFMVVATEAEYEPEPMPEEEYVPDEEYISDEEYY